LEKIIERRITQKTMGFGAKITDRRQVNIGTLLEQLKPEDLIKFGLIPEFLGRLPIITSIGELTEASLVKILTEPKNALVKQYQELFKIEGVDLQFTDEALEAMAKEAVARKSGARGLRAIMEKTMLDIMYEIPSKEDVRECVVGEEVVLKNEAPILLYEQPKKQA
jgi:ATP-dependent Clp protease ATP-binding subunit ClpX